MVMNNKINEVGRAYMFAVQPVKLFETNSSKQAQNNSFDLFSKFDTKNTGYNPFHPNVKTASVANRLDLTG